MAQTDRDALLLALFNATDGPSWRRKTNWNTDVALSDWFGVSLNGEGFVVKLHLAENNLRGSIPTELGDLRALKELYLEDNQLTGAIPPELGDLRELRELWLNNNQLTASIPPELGKLAILQSLDLSNNQLTGAIPPELGDLRELRKLWLNKNQLTGRIPEELGKLTALRQLVLYDNQLSGPIPEELGNLHALKMLHLFDNQLSGTIPEELGKLTALQQLVLYNNQLSGSIAPELGKLASLQVLNLSSNQLTGNIPAQLGQLGALKLLYLSSNKLEGPIPAELGALRELRELWLDNNELTGHIPPQLGQLGALESLRLVNNKLDGTIPEELGKLTALQQLVLYNNQLSGAIPPELGDLRELRELWLNKNQLTGAIPPELGNLEALQTLILGWNRLSGSIPPELGKLASLQLINLSLNQLTGTIPEELGKLTALQRLVLDDNQLSGPVPSELGKLGALEVLSLANNQLSGTIPPELGDLRELRELWLSSNQLTGLGETEDALRLVQSLGTVLKLHSNPFVMPPEAVVEAGIPAVEEYLFDVQAAKKAGADVTSLQLLKVVLVGSASAGKTSLMQSIIARRGSPTKGTPAQASTVGVEMRSDRLQDIKVEFFDCAGQVDYAGMHQTFLTRRAVYLLVVDITKYLGVADLDKTIHDDIMRWLYYLYLRAPGSTVIQVANKCDSSIDDFAEISERVQQRVGELLDAWHEARGLRGRSKGRVTDLTLVPGMSRVSCHEESSGEASGLPALIALISHQAATSILVPPAWDLALEVIGALRTSCDPTSAARKKLGLPITPPTGDLGDVHAFAFISKEELSCKRKSIVDNVRGDVQAAMISNSESALKGALWISDFAGHTLRIDGGDGIFLDALWLAKVLNPIVSHKLKDEFFDDEWTSMKHDLVSNRILQRPFAVHLWSESIDSVALQSEEIAGALVRTLIKLGVALPLGHTADGGSSTPQDMLVVMRLDEKCDDQTRREFDKELTSEMRPGVLGVTLKWKFDKAGPPHGLVERLIASCHVLGKVKSKACWRYGAVFKSHSKRGPANENGSLFTVALSMTSYNDPERELTATVIGPLDNARVWAAIRFVASAVVTFSKDWPGVLWEGWPECAKHPDEKVFLASSAELGDRLLSAAAPDAERGGRCDRSHELRGVLRLVRDKLGVVIDTGKDPFEGLPEEVDGSPEEGAKDTAVACHCVREAFVRWQPYAWRTALYLFGLVVVLFTTAVVTGIVEDEDALWKSSLAVVGLLLVLSAVSAAFACRFTNHAPRDEQRQSDEHHTPADHA